MKFKRVIQTVLIVLGILPTFSCDYIKDLIGKKETPTLYPIIQRGNSGEKFGYINASGEIVIQPQFAEAWFFSEGLAVACVEHGKCGFIDETGKFVINPQFQRAGRFSEGLAAVHVEDKLGYVDKTGQLVINPQFQSRWDLISIFTEGLAGVKIGEKFGFVDKTGKIIINPQFDDGLPFMEGLAAVRSGEKWGFIDNQGKIVINPQFDSAHPFVNGLAAVKSGTQWGYIDHAGKFAINPQFDFAAPFAKEGAALVFLKDKAGYVDKEGKYIVNPQYSVPQLGPGGVRDGVVLLALAVTSDLGRLSFSEGLALANTGGSERETARFGYADGTGAIVINPQFKLAFPFYGELALVMTDWNRFAWINKEGKIVWQQTMETPQPVANNTNATVNRPPSNTNTESNTNSAPTSSTTEYEGTINNNYEITMSLTRAGDTLSGYVVPKSGARSSITVRGTINRSGEFNLSEYDDKENWTGTYTGKISNGTIEGNWTKPDGSSQRPLFLSEK